MTPTETKLVVVLALLLGLIAGAMLYAKSSAQPVVPTCVTSEDRINIRAAVLAAIDEGLKEHMKFLFTGWIKDPTNQPNRASSGLQKAIVAYQQARHDALKWEPKIC